MDGHSLTLFKFIPRDSVQVATRSDPALPTPDLSPPPLPAIDVVQARNLITSSVRTDGWKSLDLPGTEVLTFDKSNCFIYKNAAPSRGSLSMTQRSEKDRPSIKDWGSPPAADELADLDVLEEFVSTDLSDIFLASPPKEDVPTIDTKGKRKAVASSESRPAYGKSTKRAKLDFVLDPKQYHYYPYPIVRKSLDLKLLQERVPPFKKSLPIYLAPHTENDVKNYLEEPFASSAWLIPIRGRLPWSDASEGKVVREDELREGDQPVVWTPTGLKKFWEFLVNIHEQQKVGPVSLSLHIVPESSGDCTGEIGGVLEQDHIKVRHDASLALTIRTVLDVWKYEATVDGRKEVDTNHLKIRPLRGAKLVLVDDCSKGLMVL